MNFLSLDLISRQVKITGLLLQDSLFPQKSPLCALFRAVSKRVFELLLALHEDRANLP